MLTSGLDLTTGATGETATMGTAFTDTALAATGFAADINGAGFTVTGFTATGFTATGVAAAGFTASGFTASGFTATGFTTAGFTFAFADLTVVAFAAGGWGDLLAADFGAGLALTAAGFFAAALPALAAFITTASRAAGLPLELLIGVGGVFAAVGFFAFALAMDFGVGLLANLLADCGTGLAEAFTCATCGFTAFVFGAATTGRTGVFSTGLLTFVAVFTDFEVGAAADAADFFAGRSVGLDIDSSSNSDLAQPCL